MPSRSCAFMLVMKSLSTARHKRAPPGHGRVSERRPIAMRNAALSVQNFKRSLRVTRTLGVDPDLGASATVMDKVSVEKVIFPCVPVLEVV